MKKTMAALCAVAAVSCMAAGKTPWIKGTTDKCPLDYKPGETMRGQAPGADFEMMTFSTFLAGCGVDGGTSRRMPKGALMSVSDFTLVAY